MLATTQSASMWSWLRLGDRPDPAEVSDRVRSPAQGMGACMLEELMALAAAGGTALVGAMATDAWEAARSGVARLLGRDDRRRVEVIEGQLEEDAALVRGAGAEGDQVREELAPAWGRRLAKVLQDNPGAAEELRILVERVHAQVPPQQQAWIQHVTATRGGTAFGQQGTGGQHVYYYGTGATGGRPDQAGDPKPDGPGSR